MRIVVVTSDLLMSSRIPGATRVAPGDPLPEADLYLFDLDETGPVPPPLTGRAVGYLSHVNDELGAAAREAGLEAWPRGRLLRELPHLLSGMNAEQAGTSGAMERQDRDLEASPERNPEDEPADGPAREPGSESDPGATSQDQPSE